jgi:hypothetical protein
MVALFCNGYSAVVADVGSNDGDSLKQAAAIEALVLFSSVSDDTEKSANNKKDNSKM